MEQVTISTRELIIIFGGIGIIMVIFALLLWSTAKDRKRRWDAIDPEKAQKMYYHGTDITPVKGDFFVRVSEWQWINVFWNKKEKTLTIQRPPKTWWHIKNHPIYIREVNWKVVREAQPKRVKLQDYMKRQVM